MFTLIGVINLRVERNQYDIYTHDVLEDLREAALLLGFGPTHQVVIVVWHAVFEVTDEAGVAVEDLLCDHLVKVLCYVLLSLDLGSEEVLSAIQY